jgi:hypothetical protein
MPYSTCFQNVVRACTERRKQYLADEATCVILPAHVPIQVHVRDGLGLPTGSEDLLELMYRSGDDSRDDCVCVQMVVSSSTDCHYHPLTMSLMHYTGLFVQDTECINEFLQWLDFQGTLPASPCLVELSHATYKDVPRDDSPSVDTLSARTEACCDATECAICKEPCVGKRTPLKCGHAFHLECITRWLKVRVNCPVCRCQEVV